MKRLVNTVIMMATALAVAFIVNSCRSHLKEAEALDIEDAPLQSVSNMFAVETKKGKVSMRMEAPKMEKYDNDSTTYDSFPEGFTIYNYLTDGRLETMIYADKARHITKKTGTQPEVWQAFGHVVIHNIIKQETIKTDTLYWDKGKNEIWTDCYVQMDSPDGLVQGYGMRSDDKARHAILYKPFDSYNITKQDSTVVIIDSVNFIGPFLKK